MSWSIAEVARMSGVTSRTLRHYDAIGLLAPESVAAGGRRFYGNDELLRLQQILLLRRLGLGLAVIADVLRHQSVANTAHALSRHLEGLRHECKRLDRLVHTVESTIESLERGEAMPAEKVFEGLEPNPYESEARERYGDEEVDASYERMRGWSESDRELARTGHQRVHDGLAPLLAAGVAVTDERVQDLIHLHHRVTCLYWRPSAEAYRGLGQMYEQDERFRRNIGSEALVGYLRQAMGAYADRRLS